ncbi:hypothetical protein GCM10025877_04560 [Agromyces mangrovi Wang et al. 2018]|nr:hypothetical protein GCM10025877_04560 [Agromyces mangrovi]
MVSPVLAPGHVVPFGVAQRVLGELEHRLLRVGVAAQVVEVAPKAEPHHVADVGSGELVDEQGRPLGADDVLDQGVDEFVARVERVVEAGERHARLGDDRSGGGLREPTACDHAQRGAHERLAPIGGGHAWHPASPGPTLDWVS